LLLLSSTPLPLIRSNNWLDGASLTNFGYDGTFTRDLFEAQIAVPGFSQPLHVFVAHLKSGTSSSDDAARRAAEASAVSNFFVTGFLTTNALHPYLLAGDMNEDIAHPATGSQQPIQRLTNNTGLQLTTPLNPFTLSPLTRSIQSTNGLNRRYDYIFPNPLLFSNIQSSQVFRTDLLNPVPSNLNSNDDIVAFGHLPVIESCARDDDGSNAVHHHEHVFVRDLDALDGLPGERRFVPVRFFADASIAQGNGARPEDVAVGGGAQFPAPQRHFNRHEQRAKNKPHHEADNVGNKTRHR